MAGAIYSANSYDNIGNRTSSGSGGDVGGSPAGLNVTTYAANDLNQYTNIVTPNLVDVIGAAQATATLSVTNKASLAGVTNSVTGTMLWPKASVLFEYDAASNLLYRTNNALVQTFNSDSLNQLTTICLNV